mgnify:CR=1 FL=1|jgi:uncharacterized protein (DUF2147 family)
MKKINLIVLALFMGLFSFAQQTNSDAIIGSWFNQEKDGVVEIYKSGSTYSGKIVWMKTPNDENGNPKVDELNPNKDLQSRQRMGMEIMYNFKLEEDKVWSNGEIYDPKSGKTYSGTITLKDENTLNLRGYVGLPIFGRTAVWTRKFD